jgi:hypothetical protein
VKLAIVGGGFFGTFLAHHLGASHDVTLFEQDSELMARSAILGQGRLQSGALYPHDLRLIAQASEGYPRFVAEFAPFLRNPTSSTYGIKKSRRGSYSAFVKNLGTSSAKFSEVAAPPAFRDSNAYEKFVQTEEKIVLVDQLKAHLVGGLKGTVRLGAEVTEVNAQKGTLKLRDGSEGKFDRIITATSSNPNLGLPLEIGFHFTFGIFAAVTLEGGPIRNEGLTALGADTTAIFPNYDGQNTVTSERFGIFSRPSNRMEFEDFWKRRVQLAKDEKVLEKIFDDAKNIFDLGPTRGAKLWFSPKITPKMNNEGSAASELRSHGKLLGIFCGNFATAYTVLDAIKVHLAKNVP